MTCLITGCLLVKECEELAVWGDLHKIGDNYVFGAVLNAHGEAAWRTDHVQHSHLIRLDLSTLPCPYFERRGVITFPLWAGNLNTVALTYLRSNHHA